MTPAPPSRIVRGYLLLAIALLVGGCLDPHEGGLTKQDPGSGTTAADPPAPPAPEAVATLETGSVQGLVVDDQQVPIGGARVSLVGPDLVVLTDDAGRFTFNDVDPGEYILQVERIGFEQGALRLAVIAGEVVEIDVVLVAISVPEPRSESFIRDGFIEFGAAPLVIALHRSTSGDPDGSDKRDHLYPVAQDALSVVAAITWDPSAPNTAQHIRFALHACAQKDCEKYNETFGGAPQTIRNDELAPKLAGHTDTAVSTYFALENCYQAGSTDISKCNEKTALQPTFQQRFSIYTTVFFVALAPEGFSPLPP